MVNKFSMESTLRVSSMARGYPSEGSQPSASQFGLAGGSLLLCAFALLMCASHTRKWRRQWRACLEYDYEYDEPVIELDSEATIVTTERVSEIEPQIGNHENMGNGEQLSVWKKNILMGGKCKLPDFSGVIIYDAEGNVVTSTKKPSSLLPWK